MGSPSVYGHQRSGFWTVSCANSSGVKLISRCSPAASVTGCSIWMPGLPFRVIVARRTPRTCLGRRVAETRIDRQPCGIGTWQRKFRVHRRRADHHGTGDPQVDRLPDSGISICHKGIAVGRILPGALVAQVLPVDPVVPTVRQLDAVDVLQRLLRGDLDRQCVRLAAVDPLRYIEFVRVVHADDPLVVGNQVTVQPDLGAIVDSGELQRIRRVARGRVERGAIPPVLLVEVLRDFIEQIRTEVEVRVCARRTCRVCRTVDGIRLIACQPESLNSGRDSAAPSAGRSLADASFQPCASSISPGGGPGRAKSGKSAAHTTSNNANETTILRTMCRRTNVTLPMQGFSPLHSVRASTSRTSSRLVSGCRNANRPTVSPSHLVGGMNAT